jgi:hypothetical protein
MESVSLEGAKQLILRKQLLAKPLRNGSSQTIEAVRRLCGLQYDPLPIVEQAHYLTLWNRIENFKDSLEEALYEGKKTRKQQNGSDSCFKSSEMMQGEHCDDRLSMRHIRGLELLKAFCQRIYLLEPEAESFRKCDYGSRRSYGYRPSRRRSGVHPHL